MAEMPGVLYVKCPIEECGQSIPVPVAAGIVGRSESGNALVMTWVDNTDVEMHVLLHQEGA